MTNFDTHRYFIGLFVIPIEYGGQAYGFFIGLFVISIGYGGHGYCRGP
jgi:dipeptide/tripeptide permease